MSQINTNGIDQDYPIPGENNSSQGFRTNFAQIKNNLNIASDEITDLQKNVVVKSALEGVEIRNDMANTLISNAAVQNFRSTVFNLGSALSGRVVVDTTLADTFTGIVSGDVTLQFAKWAPVDTDRSINLRLVFDDATAVVSFPDEVVSFDNNFGTRLLENYKDANGVATITRPATSDTVEIQLTTLDCGNTITATPVNRPFKSTQVFEREPTPMGLPGDTNGTIAIGPEKRQVEINETKSLNVEITSNVVVLSNSAIVGNELTFDFISGPRVAGTGNITTESGNIEIIGSSTIFEDEFEPGTVVYKQDGAVLGTIATISSNTEATLESGAALTVTDQGFTYGEPADVQLDMLLSGSNVTANTFVVEAIGFNTFEVSESSSVTGIEIEGKTGIVGNKLVVGVESSGEVYPGMILTGNDIEPNTRVLELVAGEGDGAEWEVSVVQFEAPATINGSVDLLNCDSTSGLSIEEPVTFTGSVFGNIEINTTYYVDSIISDTEFTISTEPSGNMFVVDSATGIMFANPAAYLYLCVDDFQGELSTKQVTDTDSDGNFIRVSNTNNIDVNTPVFFTGNLTGSGLEANKIYYVKTVGTPNAEDLTLSLTRFNGVAGATVRVQTADLTGVTMTFINGGRDIWRRVNLNAW